MCTICYIYVFFFQEKAGIRDVAVTGVQTCALPISGGGAAPRRRGARPRAARAGHDPPRRGRSTGGGDGDHAQYGVSTGQRAVKRLTILLTAFTLPLAGRPDCGLRIVDCGIDRSEERRV